MPPWELKEVTFNIIHPDGRKAEFTLREIPGAEDQAYMDMFTDKMGKMSTQELWVKRFTRCIINPKLSTEEIRNLPTWIWQGLLIKWTQMNNPDISNFLEKSTAEAETTPSLPIIS